jgi:rSAM/selenodomain-associated transferase 1
LGVFAKEPRPGQVKTRLAAETSTDWAVRIATAFLDDTLARLAALDVPRVLAFAPVDARAFFAARTQELYTLVEQGEGDLGRRMAAFFAGRIQAGATSVVLVGTDSPTVPLDYIADAFAALQAVDVVFGPALDGGYYLVGCARLVPELFERISWSTPDVLRQTAGRIQLAGAKVRLLPPWFDVDTLADWRALQGHFAAQRLAGIDAKAPRTEALLIGPDSTPPGRLPTPRG